jgi:hypothetical protein
MSITLELTLAEETRLRDAASAHNLDLPEFLKWSGFQAARRDEELKARWSITEESARAAVRDAQQAQLGKGIPLVYEKDGVVVEELPSGMVRPLTAPEAH